MKQFSKSDGSINLAVTANSASPDNRTRQSLVTNSSCYWYQIDWTDSTSSVWIPLPTRSLQEAELYAEAAYSADEFFNTMMKLRKDKKQ